jgi:hypothetical protein
MEPWFGLATLLDLVCGILWAMDAREIVSEDGEVCNVGNLQAACAYFSKEAAGWSVCGMVPRHRVEQCPHKIELYLQKNDPLYATYGCS